MALVLRPAIRLAPLKQQALQKPANSAVRRHFVCAPPTRTTVHPFIREIWQLNLVVRPSRHRRYERTSLEDCATREELAPARVGFGAQRRKPSVGMPLAIR